MVIEQTTNAVPRISANKLAEYIVTSNPVRRAQIVKDAKNPSAFKVVRYKDAREAIVKYLMNGFDDTILNECIKYLKSLNPNTLFEEDDIKNSILALEATKNIEVNELVGCEIEKNTGNKLLNIKGLNISVNPDLVINNLVTGKVGSLKVHISKSNTLSDDALLYVGVLLKSYLMNDEVDEKTISDELCVAVDCFEEKYKLAPKNYKRMFGRVEAACTEFLLKWNSID